MNKKLVAEELLKVAKTLLSMEFPSQDALDEYLKEHPGADKSHHTVRKSSPTDTALAHTTNSDAKNPYSHAGAVDAHKEAKNFHKSPRMKSYHENAAAAHGASKRAKSPEDHHEAA